MSDEPAAAATAVLPVIAPDADGTGLLTHRDAAGPWRACVVLFDVTTQQLVGPPTRTRFPVTSGRLGLDGSTVTELDLQAGVPERPSGAYRALLGRAAPGAPGFTLRCTLTAGRRRLAGELLVGGLARVVSLRIKLLDAQHRRVLIWLTGQVRVPVRERRIGHSLPRLLIAAEFTR